MTKTNISWTDASWNPVTGCSKVSPGCQFCYAETLSLHMGWSEKEWAAPYAAENVVLHPDRLELPLRWEKPRMIFVNSMSDLFHERVPDAFILNVFAIMEQARSRGHVFEVLTKRPERMAAWVAEHARWVDYAAGEGEYLRRYGHVWLGTSVEDQRRADERIPHLLATPAAVRFLSCEPLLGPLDLTRFWRPYDTVSAYRDVPLAYDSSINWIICGGESGNHLTDPDQDDRWMNPAWARSLRDQCVAASVPFFMKQHSGRRPGMQPYIVEEDGSHTEWHQFPEVSHGGH